MSRDRVAIACAILFASVQGNASAQQSRDDQQDWKFAPSFAVGGGLGLGTELRATGSLALHIEATPSGAVLIAAHWLSIPGEDGRIILASPGVRVGEPHGGPYVSLGIGPAWFLDLDSDTGVGGFFDLGWESRLAQYVHVGAAIRILGAETSHTREGVCEVGSGNGGTDGQPPPQPECAGPITKAARLGSVGLVVTARFWGAA